MLIYVVLAGLLVLIFRAACLGQAAPALGIAPRLLTGLWLAFAAWTAGGLLHAWVPIWKLVAMGIGLSIVVLLTAERLKSAVRAAMDLAMIAALGVLSVVPVQIASIVAAAVIFALTGIALDYATRRLPRSVQFTALLVPLAVLAVMAMNIRQADDFGTRLRAQDPLFPLRLAFATPTPGKRVPLKSGTICWRLDNPAGSPRGLVIFLHGNHPAGSLQPAAIALQGAMLRAGYDVLSVDHPGYGASPHPSADADWSAWDPRIGLREALSYAQSQQRFRSQPITLVGHSMGVDTTLMWMKDGFPIKDVYLFAGAITRPPDTEEAGFQLWHAQRAMPCCISLETMRRINSAFYADASLYAHDLPANHPLIHFTRFGIEYADVAIDREVLYADIPGPKVVCDIPGVTHYINTLSIRRFALLDTAATVELAAVFTGSSGSASVFSPCSEATTLH